MLYGLMVDVMDEEDPIPIVRHVFFGRSEEEVSGKFARHVERDQFLSDVWSGEIEGLSLVYKWGEKG